MMAAEVTGPIPFMLLSNRSFSCQAGLALTTASISRSSCLRSAVRTSMCLWIQGSVTSIPCPDRFFSMSTGRVAAVLQTVSRNQGANGLRVSRMREETSWSR